MNKILHKKKLLGLILLTGLILSMSDLLFPKLGIKQYPQSQQYAEDKFHNPVATNVFSLRKFGNTLHRFVFDKSPHGTPAHDIPVHTLTVAELNAAEDNTLYRLGHSTLLLKLHNEFWLTDPVFSERASPVQWMGPKRFHPPPINIEDLPNIKGVILSHDHFDHLDEASIKKLADKVEYFLTPLGVGDILINWGIAQSKIKQLDWWQSTQISGIEFVATPAQHFSGRGITGGNQTLWASWVILSNKQRIFFSGDSGYFDGFKKIGEQYGPFDITLLETGAYDKNWANIHMLPEDTLQAHLDLKGNWLLPIHNGTFDLAMHAWDEPFERITALALSANVNLTTPAMGQTVKLSQPPAVNYWWQARNANEQYSALINAME